MNYLLNYLFSLIVYMYVFIIQSSNRNNNKQEQLLTSKKKICIKNW